MKEENAMHLQKLLRKSISGVVVSAFILIMAVLLTTFFMTALRSHRELTIISSERIEKEAEALSMIKYIEAYMITEDDTITLNLTNNYIESISLTGIILYYEGGYFDILPSSSLKYSVFIKASLYDYRDRIVRSWDNLSSFNNSLPLILQTGYKLQVKLSIKKDIKSAKASISEADIVTVISFKALPKPPAEWSFITIPEDIWTKPGGSDYSYAKTSYTLQENVKYPSTASIETGAYISGSLPDDVMASDDSYYIVESTATSYTTREYHPSSINTLLGSTSGSVSNIQGNDDILYVNVSAYPYTYAPRAYFRNLTYAFQGTTYYKLMIQSPITEKGFVGTATIRSSGTWIILVGDFIYPLQSYRGLTIPAGTWTVYYYVWYKTSGIVIVRYANAYINIGVIKSDGTITYVSTNVAVAPLQGTESITYATYNFPGYTVAEDDEYLLIEYRIEINVRIFFFGSVTVYVVLEDPNTYIQAGETWASTYAAEVEFIGTSNTAEDWLYLLWGLDIRADITNVNLTIQLYNYNLDTYPTSGSGYMYFTNISTTDTIYSQNITTYPEYFRDGTTGEFKIKVFAKRAVDWNEGFTLYIDYMFYKPTYYNEYTAKTMFIITDAVSENVAKLVINFEVEHDTSITSFKLYLWDYTTSSWVNIYSSSGSLIADSVAITVSPENYIYGSEIKLLVESIYISDNAFSFQQKSDLIEVIEYLYEAPALVVAGAGYDYLILYKYLTNQWNTINLPLTLNKGFSFTSVTSDLYVVYGGNTINFTKIDLLTGSFTALANLPVNSTYSLLVYVPSQDYIYYLPDARTGSTFYIYDIANDVWTGSITLPLTPPVYDCIGYADIIICVDSSGLTIYNVTSNDIVLTSKLPLYENIAGLIYDDSRDWIVVAYYTGEIYAFNKTAGMWLKLTPNLPNSSTAEGSRLTCGPKKYLYLRPYSRFIYIIKKTQFSTTQLTS